MNIGLETLLTRVQSRGALVRRLCGVGVLALLTLLMPSAYAELNCAPLSPREAFPTPVYERGLLWRISRDGQPDSYLFGTIHISDPAVMAFDPSIQQAFEASKQFVLEVVLDPEAIQQMQHSMFYHEGETLSGQIGPALFDAVRSLAPTYGIPDELMDYMRPWAIYMTLSVPPGGGLPMDLALMLEAERSGMPVFGLESVEEQTSVLGDLSMSEQIDLLTQTVCHYEQLQKETKEMVGLYVERDLAGLMTESMRYTMANARTDARVFESLIWRRNQTMFERLKPLLKTDSSFVAVGALHLPGERGLLALLVRDGYRVEAVY